MDETSERRLRRSLVAGACAVALALVAVRIGHASFRYLIWTDRDLVRASEALVAWPTAGAEMNYGTGARVPGGACLYALWAMQGVGLGPEGIVRVLFAAEAALVAGLGVGLALDDVLTQLGFLVPYAPDANGSPGVAAWGVGALLGLGLLAGTVRDLRVDAGVGGVDLPRAAAPPPALRRRRAVAHPPGSGRAGRGRSRVGSREDRPAPAAGGRRLRGGGARPGGRVAAWFRVLSPGVRLAARPRHAARGHPDGGAGPRRDRRSPATVARGPLGRRGRPGHPEAPVGGVPAARRSLPDVDDQPVPRHPRRGGDPRRGGVAPRGRGRAPGGPAGGRASGRPLGGGQGVRAPRVPAPRRGPDAGGRGRGRGPARERPWRRAASGRAWRCGRARSTSSSSSTTSRCRSRRWADHRLSAERLRRFPKLACGKTERGEGAEDGTRGGRSWLAAAGAPWSC